MARKKVKKGTIKTRNSFKHAKSRSRKNNNNNNNKHDLQHYAMVVFVASVGVSILFMLGGYTNAVGMASASGGLETAGAIESLSSAQIYKGEGDMNCASYCTRLGDYAIVSSYDGEVVENNQDNYGSATWTCLCVGED